MAGVDGLVVCHSDNAGQRSEGRVRERRRGSEGGREGRR